MIKTIITIASLLIVPTSAFALDEPAPILQNKEKPLPAIHLQPAKYPPTKDISSFYISEKNAKLGKKGRKATKLANDWIRKPILPTVGEDGGSVVYTFGATLPVIVCRPLRVSTLILEYGEKIIEKPRSGDTAQWKISPSKPNNHRAPHIFIKPLDSGLTTNLIIVTDRRTYVIALKSRNDKYTPVVSFRYPENEARAWDAHLAEQARQEKENQQNNRFKSGNKTFNAENLDFNYSTNGEAKWKPLRIFNDGVKTYLKMPKIMEFYEAPILLTINDGQEALVNYRLHEDLFIVDQLFESAVLLSGVGSNQTKITITHDLMASTQQEDLSDDF
jgi:type IV secretion system protein VirB9